MGPPSVQIFFSFKIADSYIELLILNDVFFNMWYQAKKHTSLGGVMSSIGSWDSPNYMPQSARRLFANSPPATEEELQKTQVTDAMIDSLPIPKEDQHKLKSNESFRTQMQIQLIVFLRKGKSIEESLHPAATFVLNI